MCNLWRGWCQHSVFELLGVILHLEADASGQGSTADRNGF